MNLFKIDIGDIADLTTNVAINGAIITDTVGDDVFEYIVGIAVLIHEMFPG